MGDYTKRASRCNGRLSDCESSEPERVARQLSAALELTSWAAESAGWPPRLHFDLRQTPASTLPITECIVADSAHGTAVSGSMK